ncbi:hypothetical protein ACP70R_037914 [Stipagrostis hirtigluma subsp. patula]
MEPGLLEKRDEQYVWPWMGVLVNVPTELKDGRRVGLSANRLKEQLSRFHPLKVNAVWNARGHTGCAIIEFGKDLGGFTNALAFENYFDREGHGRSDWKVRTNQRSQFFGWVAREEDYRHPGPTGDHLRRNGDLRTLSDLENERVRRAGKLVAHLANQVEVKDRHLHELKCKYDEIATSIDKVVEAKEQVVQSYYQKSL